MGIFGRKWMAQHHDQAVFDLMDLYQFHSTSCRYIFGYMFMYFSIIISLAVYVSDIYTAVVLLALNRWSSNIQPFVPFRISRWLFAGCIILSIILLIYEYIVSWTLMRGKNVALNYTNPIARNLWSIRGYRYFCLFAKITKSRSKTEYIALFVYFTFKGWIRLLLADSPRQVLNALTLYSVLKVQDDFIATVKHIANSSILEAIVIAFMAFSLFIWVLNVIQFMFAVLCACPLYVHIDKQYSGLEEYICVRINRRIQFLVQKHHRKGLMELKEANRKLTKQPTLPNVQFEDHNADETFEKILGDDGESNRKYLAFRKDVDIEKLAEESKAQPTKPNPFEGINEYNSQDSRTGYGFGGYNLPVSESREALLGGLHSQNSQSSLRTYDTQSSLQYYPNQSQRSLTNPSETSSSSILRHPSTERYATPQSSVRFVEPPPSTPHGAFRQAAQLSLPVRSVSSPVEIVNANSPEASLPPSSVTFDQYTPQIPPQAPQRSVTMPNPSAYNPNIRQPPPRSKRLPPPIQTDMSSYQPQTARHSPSPPSQMNRVPSTTTSYYANAVPTPDAPEFYARASLPQITEHMPNHESHSLGNKSPVFVLESPVTSHALREPTLPNISTEDDDFIDSPGHTLASAGNRRDHSYPLNSPTGPHAQPTLPRFDDIVD